MDAAQAARRDNGVLVALAVRVEDRTATLAALITVGPLLERIAAHWHHHGLRGADLDDAEAELVACALEALRTDPGAGAAGIAQIAWHRWNTGRRTTRRRAEKAVPLAGVEPWRHATDGERADPLPPLLADAVTDGSITRDTAQVVLADLCGWSTGEIAAAKGWSIDAVWARRSRARRALRAAVADREMNDKGTQSAEAA